MAYNSRIISSSIRAPVSSLWQSRSIVRYERKKMYIEDIVYVYWSNSHAREGKSLSSKIKLAYKLHATLVLLYFARIWRESRLYLALSRYFKLVYSTALSGLPWRCFIDTVSLPLSLSLLLPLCLSLVGFRSISFFFPYLSASTNSALLPIEKESFGKRSFIRLQWENCVWSSLELILCTWIFLHTMGREKQIR